MHKRILLYAGSLLLLIFCSYSCKKYQCIQGEGPVERTYFTPGRFSGVIVNMHCEVFLVKDTVYKVAVETNNNITDRFVDVYIENRNANLIIEKKDKKKCFKTDEPIRIYVYTPELYNIELKSSGLIVCDHFIEDRLRVILSGSGTIDLYDLVTDNIYADLSGSGKIKLHGRNGQSTFKLGGSGQIYAINLIQESCYAQLPGAGDILVQVTDFLDATISGSGNVVYYYVRPLRIEQHINGNGNVIGSLSDK